MWLSLHECELRAFNYDPGDRLSSGSAPAVGTMTVRANPDVRRCAEAYLAAIAATCNLILFHSRHYKRRVSIGAVPMFPAGRGVGFGTIIRNLTARVN